MSENMKIHESLKPIAITHLKADTFIIDMGQNMTGWVKIQNLKGKRGASISLRFAETLKADGSLNTANLRSAKQTDIYTMRGDALESWEPSFVNHGFRYMEISGYSETLSIGNFLGQVIYDNMETTGHFESSNDILNSIYKNAYWGIRGNYKGIPLDCPQRDERQPWLGDRTTGSLGESYIFGNEKLYTKWLKDIQDSQLDNGQLSDIAPPFYMTYYSDNMTCPGTYMFIADMLYNQFGNPQPIIEHYPSMKKWFSYMTDKYLTVDYIMTKDKYGDWCVPPESKEMIHSQDPARKTDGELIATAYCYKILLFMQKFAKISNNTADIQTYADLAENVRVAFKE